MTQRFANITLGRIGTFGPYLITQSEIVEFASKYNPLPYHVDPKSEEAARAGGLMATGWHTAAVLMRLATDHWLRDVATKAGVGAELSFLRPVRPGDELYARIDVVDMDRSRRGSAGKVRWSGTLLADHEAVLTAVITMLVAG